MTRYVDTNILVRIVTNDLPESAARALAVIEAANANELVVLDAVVAEFFYVLCNSPYYGRSRAEASLDFGLLLATPQFSFSPLALAAFNLFTKHAQLDFADCLLAAAANGQADHVFSFDKALLKILR